MKNTGSVQSTLNFGESTKLRPEKQGLIAIEGLLHALEENGFLPDMTGSKFDGEEKPAENIHTEGDRINLGFRYTYNYDRQSSRYSSLEHFNVASVPREHKGFRDMAETVYDDVVRLYEERPAGLLNGQEQEKLRVLKEIKPKILNLLLSGQSTEKLLAYRKPEAKLEIPPLADTHTL